MEIIADWTIVILSLHPIHVIKVDVKITGILVTLIISPAGSHFVTSGDPLISA